MIRNTIYTSNSNLGTMYSDVNSLIMQTLQNVQERQNKLSKTGTYAEMLKSMQEKYSTSESEQTKSTAEMTMNEYKAYINEEIKKIDFDSSRFDDDEVIQISDAGWKAMKADPNYESWVLDKIKASRQVKNQYATMGFGGSYYILSFGAKKSDFNEQTWFKNFSKVDKFFSGLYDMSSFLGTKSKSKYKGLGSIFSMQAERLRMQSQIATNYMNANQKIKSSLSSAFQNIKYYL